MNIPDCSAYERIVVFQKSIVTSILNIHSILNIYIDLKARMKEKTFKQ